MKNNKIYLQHIIEAIDKIQNYLKGLSYKSFLNNEIVIDAVVRQLEIIGEAANNINKNFQKKYPRIPWKKMIGIRNRLIHEYFGINKEIVWETCKKDLKELKNFILEILKR